jgi:hypothetical protein
VDYEYEYYSDEPSMTTGTQQEEEYLDFLQEFGSVDFSHLLFLPKIRTVSELED